MRCSHCGDIIGVYEPLVALTAGRALETSLAAGAVRGEHDASCYHRDCYSVVSAHTTAGLLGCP
jgi:hypothetical protein